MSERSRGVLWNSSHDVLVSDICRNSLKRAKGCGLKTALRASLAQIEVGIVTLRQDSNTFGHNLGEFAGDIRHLNSDPSTLARPSLTPIVVKAKYEEV